MESLSIYILCHNRPDDARQAIKSVINQDDQEFTLVVSDNSSNDEVEHMVRSEFPEVHYIRRLPMLKPLEHFNRCIDEVRADLFCLFHDDDIMHPEYVMGMRAAMNAHPEVVACGCNAKIDLFGKIEPRTSFRALCKFEWVNSPRNLARRYFSRAQCGIAPFPSYVYRCRLVGDVRLPVEGGKYADVTWLLSLAMKGRIVWLATPLMTYRLHGGNDGSIESLRDRLRFMGFIKHNSDALGKDVLADYRCSFIYKPLSKDVTALPVRLNLARTVLKHYNWTRYANPALYANLLKRALIKRVAK